MKRPAAIAGSALFFVIAPLTIAGIIPFAISQWVMLPPFHETEATRYIGVALVLAGLPVLLDSFARFAVEGLGTPAPIAPPQQLVVSGLYRYVRNPMYVAVCSIILGQSLFFADMRLLAYAAFMWLAFHIFVVTYEEPTLAETYGDAYRAFRANVPRWLPRLTPWRG